MPGYEDKTVYAKYLKASLSSSHSGCSECSDHSSNDYCECCPPGLVEVKDVDGNRVGCLTPSDADQYNSNNRTCQQGYLPLYKEGETPEFRGCVSESVFAELYAVLNPS
jgi:hypothetical protein